MDKEEKKQWTSENYKYTGTDSEKVETQSNTGKNDSDYDGGHPSDTSNEEHKFKENEQEHSASDSYNSGKNDSDYDGGHPADVNPKSGNQVSSKDKS
ncbi:hypothetical protein A1A1_05067 [Planococcus antarcticus DSM 14505]|uniref:Uncharacterized protein n=1 Tax=Planococcus antarcticus DSM 14505 TaxID=1185653 RepID=A0A1C7DEK2_9BACL|nr:hypothetical protein [Planococcus antarcticus]ANU09842.1 hypothetical protein BBH88_05780 [Planococcus antarcticus DSM 14505]EIM07553.1 hypothetical protein A1A1_05067 [Planococcus antarcticus DSM 14505]